jgi:hypothetical protein
VHIRFGHRNGPPLAAIFFAAVRESTGFAPIVHRFSTRDERLTLPGPGRTLVAVFRPALAVLLLAIACLLAVPASAQDASPALLRVFLTDGTGFVSYGEWARLGDRVIFSMPLATGAAPELRLVTLPAGQVDWPRTERYAAAARAAHYTASRAEADYAQLGNEVAGVLNQIAREPDGARRLALAEQARRSLATWPEQHFGYRQADVREMLALLDEIISELRVAAGKGTFELGLVAEVPPPPAETLLPPPTAQELASQLARASQLADTSVERVSLLQALLAVLDRAAAYLPGAWADALRRTATTTIEEEQRTESAYAALRLSTLASAPSLAGKADVRGLERLRTQVFEEDRRLGKRRPSEVAVLVAAVEADIERARRLRLAQDQFHLRQDTYKSYNRSVRPVLSALKRASKGLEDIRAQAGPSARSLDGLHARLRKADLKLATLVPPDALQSVHAVIRSACELAVNAVMLRLDAVTKSDLERATRASAAAAGALMMAARARSDLQAALRPPTLQ